MGGVIGLAAVAALAAVALLWSDREGGASEPPEAAQTQQQADGAAAGAFVPPDREAVREAYAEVGRVYRASGVSGLAEVGRSCFAGLAEQPSYRGLDYCTALDAFGAAFAQRVNGAPPAPDSWFGQAEGRYLSTAEQVMGPERDAAARLVDIRRLAIEVAREGGPAFAAASSAQGPPQPRPPRPRAGRAQTRRHGCACAHPPCGAAAIGGAGDCSGAVGSRRGFSHRSAGPGSARRSASPGPPASRRSRTPGLRRRARGTHGGRSGRRAASDGQGAQLQLPQRPLFGGAPDLPGSRAGLARPPSQRRL